MLDGFLRDHPWILPPTEVPEGAGNERYNIAPTQPVAAVLGDDDGSAHVEYLKWGLIPSWADDPAIGNKMINARAETLGERAAFRRLLAGQRCLVVADGFYEWRKPAAGRAKTPFFVRMRSGRPFALAGLWDRWRDPATRRPVGTCTIITGEPNALVAELHHRMAVIVRPGDYQRWLSRGPLSPEAMAAFAQPYPADEMEAYPVSPAVNSPAAQGEQLTRRAAERPPAQPSLFGDG